MKSFLFILNASPYGHEASLSALRLAAALTDPEAEPVSLRLFLMSDAVVAALAGQDTGGSTQNLGDMLAELARGGAEIRLCRTCLAARGLLDAGFVPGAAIGTLADVAGWMRTADQILTF
ncbi:DsrE/DsrF/TusD sulfur relay family protein [Microvirgula aerodenitrificans]|uniref:DsrE/DsrF/TusD sulfur relay family protein n=1 Tax=Microvirgula aerodenitrificans TaxID=57480 RepID=UPI00248F384E|nr:DsrE family protein [Microvirgula aerodenitrificans]